MKFAYEECVGELRQQAASIQRLEDLVETQGEKIKQLETVSSQQQRDIEKTALILRHSSMIPDSSPLRPSDFATEKDTPAQDKTVFKSCDDIRSVRPSPVSSDSGSHWIDPDGLGGDNAVQVFCDMSNGTTSNFTLFNLFIY